MRLHPLIVLLLRMLRLLIGVLLILLGMLLVWAAAGRRPSAGDAARRYWR